MSSQISRLFQRRRSAAAEPCFFLDLPVEIRLEVYHFMLQHYLQRPPEDGSASRGDFHLNTHLHFHEPTHPLYALLFVTRNVRLEVARVLYTTAPPLKFGSPHRCLYFLRWTAPELHRLRSLRIAVPSHDTYSLEPVFDFLVKSNIPLERLAINFLNINCAFKKPPKKLMLSAEAGAEELAQAHLQGRELSRLYGEDLTSLTPRAPWVTFPRTKDAAAEEAAEPHVRSLLGQLTTLRYLETIYHPTGLWAVECELAILSLQAKIFDSAAAEGARVILGASQSSVSARKYVNIDLDGPPEAAYRSSTISWHSSDGDAWMDSRYWIEGTDVQAEDLQDIPRMGVRYLETYRRRFASKVIDVVVFFFVGAAYIVIYVFLALYILYTFLIFLPLVHIPVSFFLGWRWRGDTHNGDILSDWLLCRDLWPQK